ncbi:MFS transporter [Thiolapillus brandeum]|uniref:Major facilitator transporter n=1 Tax=Thiolapillus brandeum TaxID=1076588 RepID=A0A7U6GGV9_9GAMM|nr:MFS transporter [Thiolapillus brandeum]BAO43334.1 major facilitator transporter [Thiolapillus brandeum]
MTNQTAGLNSQERRATYGLAGIYGSRMLGLFLILPVFALYAEHLASATPVLIGMAIGIYGLTQAVLQIPFGLLSDKIGRKPVIIGGLLLFALGSVIAATADDIHMIIVGRAIQGSGAIAAAVMALLADLTRDEQRTKSMAVVGVTIGFSFTVALIAGPLFNTWVGVPGLFWITAALAIAGILILVLVVPTPDHSSVHSEAEPVPGMFGKVLRDTQLLRLDAGIFTLHLVLTSLFLALPLVLRDAGLPVEKHTWLYLPVMLLSMGLMVPFVIIAEKKGKMKQVFTSAIGLLGLALAGFWVFSGSIWGLGLMLLVFFTGFNLLEATLPSLVSKLAPGAIRGTAMGVYSTSQFSGAFVGGLLGGWVHTHFGETSVFLMALGFIALWLLLAVSMQTPAKTDAT